MSSFKDGNDCPYRFICENKTSDGDCNKLCERFHEINTLFSNANIPRRYLQPFTLYPSEMDIINYETLNEIKNNILQLVSYGINVYISSPIRQNGKTSWAIKIIQQFLHYVRQESGSRKRALYVDVSDYIKELKSSFDNENKEIREFEIDIANVDIVVWDNIDSYKLTEWERGIIKQHIKKRLANNLSNIFVGNYLDNRLTLMVGEDLKYYIQDNSTNIPLLEKRGEGE